MIDTGATSGETCLSQTGTALSPHVTQTCDNSSGRADVLSRSPRKIAQWRGQRLQWHSK